jgi:Flp pilus assembly protein TadD
MTVVLETRRGTSHHDTTLESQSLYNLAIEKINRNRFREALDHLVTALRMAPTNSRYLSYFGYCLAQAEGDHARAVHLCRQAANSRPMDPVCRINLGKVYKLTGNNRTAHKEFLMAWEISKGNPSAAAELTRMGIRRPPVIPFLPRSNWCNKYLGMLRATLERRLLGHRAC